MVNLTDTSFGALPLYSKIWRVFKEPRKAIRALKYRVLSIVGSREFCPFIILTRDRTGSNMLVQYLNSHPNIAVEYEAIRTLYGRSVDRVLAKIYGKQPRRIKAKGFKIFYYHPVDSDGRETWKKIAAIEDLRVIHLKRRNIFHTAVSSKIAYATGVYGILPGQKTKAKPRKTNPIHYPATKLEEAFRTTQQWEHQGEKFFDGHEIINIYHEDLVFDPARELNRICAFLGVPNHQMSTEFRKQRTKGLRDSVENYDELKQHFAGTEWEKHFDE